ncbi:MAG: signal peptidase II [Nitriliruptorales bacterium]|nr:signal peptidase II [Nitriliruptorales bacterium]
MTCAGLVVSCDQVSKAWAHATSSALVEPVTNPDLALGVASGDPVTLTITMLVGLVVFGWHVVLRVRRGALSPVAAGLLIGGAAGNLVDRALLGSVRDFLSTPWVVFNLADVALVVGTCWYVTAAITRTDRVRRVV